MTRRVRRVALLLFLIPMLFFWTALTASAASDITITFVRHGESEGNASNMIDTSTPGPHLTSTGQTQAQAVADKLAADGTAYDAIYVSNMVRTSETAAPFAAATGLTPVELSGLREISAGWLEGQPEKDGVGRLIYGLLPMTWVAGAQFIPIPGGESGLAFNDRFSSAIDTIYASGAKNPVVFSHGAAIMYWVLMNTDNPDPMLFLQHPLNNTDVVVVTGNPEDGWTLVSWAGEEVDQDPSLPVKAFVTVRKLVVAPQATLYQLGKSIASGQIVADVTTPVTKSIALPANGSSSVASDLAGVDRLSALTATVRSTSAPTVTAPLRELAAVTSSVLKAPVAGVKAKSAVVDTDVVDAGDVSAPAPKAVAVQGSQGTAPSDLGASTSSPSAPKSKPRWGSWGSTPFAGPGGRAKWGSKSTGETGTPSGSGGGSGKHDSTSGDSTLSDSPSGDSKSDGADGSSGDSGADGATGSDASAGSDDGAGSDDSSSGSDSSGAGASGTE